MRGACLLGLLGLVSGCGYGGPMPSASRQLRVFFSSPSPPSQNELAQDLAPLMMFLSSMTQDYDDDASGFTLYQSGGNRHSLLLQRLAFMRFTQRQPQSSPCAADVKEFCHDIEVAATSPFPVRKCLQMHSARLTDRCTNALENSPTVVEKCFDDINDHCEDVEAGNSKIHKCLSQVPSLSETCVAHFKQIEFPVVKQRPESRWEEAQRRLKWSVVQGHLKQARSWAAENKKSIFLGAGLLLVSLLFIVNILDLLDEYRNEWTREEDLKLAGYTLLVDDNQEEEDIEI